jgi:transmembrane sensor
MSLLPSDEPPWQALVRYFAGEIKGPEADALNRWIDEDPERRELVERLREIWGEAAALRQTWNAEAALKLIKQGQREPARVIPLTARASGETAPAPGGVVAVALRIAAAVAILVGGLAVWQAVLTSRGEKAPPAEVATRRGQRATVRFPDGTTVLLAPASTLRYAPGFSRRPRAVDLDGQAYFTVTHDERHPFAVRTAHGVARDLGTRFVVRAYPSDSLVDVVVAEGRVSLTSVREPNAPHQTAHSLLLAQGDLGWVTAAGRLAAEHGVALERYLGWTEGRLEFQDTPLRDAALQLGRWYDLDVQLADSGLGAKRLTATFRDEPASEVLHLVAASLDVRVAQQGRVVIIRPKQHLIDRERKE